MAKTITFFGVGDVRLDEREVGRPGPGHVRVRSRVSLMSTGTEGICFMRKFAPGTHWDNWVKYPFHTGYSTVAHIEELGEGVEGWMLGDRVCVRVCHSEAHVVGTGQLIRVPEGLSDEEAAWFALGQITFMGARAAEYEIGDQALIVGAGPIGQLSARWAVALGCRDVVVLDPVTMRLDLAKKGGATQVIGLPAGEAKQAVEEAFGGELPRVVIDTTGHAAVFEKCLAFPQRKGNLVLLGDTGDPSQQRLTPDVVTRGIRIHGAHMVHEDAEWFETKICGYFLNLVARKRLTVAELNLHAFRPEQCVEAFDLATHRRDETMGILFDWR